MKNQAIREIRSQEQCTLDIYRERYERLVEEGKHARAATVRGQITRQCGVVDGIDKVLEGLQ